MTRQDAAAIFERIATLLELKGENPFKTRAYRTGAEIVESFSGDIMKLAAENQLAGIKGLGEALRRHGYRAPYAAAAAADLASEVGRGIRPAGVLLRHLAQARTDQLGIDRVAGGAAGLGHCVGGAGGQCRGRSSQGQQRRRGGQHHGVAHRVAPRRVSRCRAGCCTH